MRCSESAITEPLAGTAPLARWWWLIEVPGAWGRDAVADCRVAAVRTLASTSARRVLLIRRAGRHPAADDATLRVWFAGGLPGDPPTRVVDADPRDIASWPDEGPPHARPDPLSPVLAVCTNSSRDLCCGIDGRALITALSAAGAEGVWECSHLGGHRFAPTALHVPTGLVYGRLTDAVARRLLDAGPDEASAPWLRGRSALDPPAQAAEIALLRQGVRPDPTLVQVNVTADEAVVTFAGTPPVHLQREAGPSRSVSCGRDAEASRPWLPSGRA